MMDLVRKWAGRGIAQMGNGKGGGQAEGHCVIVILGRNDTYGVEKEEGTGRRTLYDNGSWEE